MAGSFALMHTAVMHGAENTLAITIVPGSGTGELAGISGCLKLDIVERKHHDVLEYAFA